MSRICNKCGIIIEHPNGVQKYCGSKMGKTGCSWKMAKMKMIQATIRWQKRNPEHIRKKVSLWFKKRYSEDAVFREKHLQRNRNK